jgi:hypothetical protein
MRKLLTPLYGALVYLLFLGAYLYAAGPHAENAASPGASKGSAYFRTNQI